MNNRCTPFTAILLAAALLLAASYEAAYFFLVVRSDFAEGGNGRVAVRTFPRYSCRIASQRTLNTFFWPAHLIDRAVRPHIWAESDEELVVPFPPPEAVD